VAHPIYKYGEIHRQRPEKTGISPVDTKDWRQGLPQKQNPLAAIQNALFSFKRKNVYRKNVPSECRKSSTAEDGAR